MNNWQSMEFSEPFTHNVRLRNERLWYHREVSSDRLRRNCRSWSAGHTDFWRRRYQRYGNRKCARRLKEAQASGRTKTGMDIAAPLPNHARLSARRSRRFQHRSWWRGKWFKDVPTHAFMEEIEIGLPHRIPTGHLPRVGTEMMRMPRRMILSASCATRWLTGG